MRIANLFIVGCLGLQPINALRADEPNQRKPTPKEFEFFEKSVRPVLVARCVECHGAKKQESGLRLDSRAAVLKGGDSGPAAKPGDPKSSEMIRAVRQTGSLKMPPEDKLKPSEVQALSKWITLGLPWPKSQSAGDVRGSTTHWAFQPIRIPAVPDVKRTNWPRTPIDRFILAKLEANRLQPFAAADRGTLIRRATFNLIGLPPTPEEVGAFKADTSPDAFETLVDRLLASPHYGERWGRYWLDVARYADNKGYVFFEEKTFPWAFTYRDYVIRSFNEDLPYNRFVLEQLAADQLQPDGDKRALAAMGYLTLGGRFMNNLHDILDDRIDVVTRGLMGLTVTCARCHDHKYDPIPQADYYSLYGVFRSSVEPTVRPMLTPPPETDEYRTFDKELMTRVRKLEEFVHKKHAELVASSKTRAAEYLLAAQAAIGRPSMDRFMLLVEAGGLNPTMVNRWKKYLESTAKTRHSVWSPWHELATVPQHEFAAKAAALISRLSNEANQSRPVNPHVLNMLSESPPASLNELAGQYSQLLNGVEKQWRQTLKNATGAKRPLPSGFAESADEELRQAFHGPNAPPDVPVVLGAGFLALLPDRPAQAIYKKLLKEVETHISTGKGAPPRAMVLVDSPTPFNPRVFLRGNHSRLGSAVPRQFLSVIAGENRQPFTQGSGRLELARAITDRKNPLTARVIVNRVWQHHFGEGLVRTPSDFGFRSDPPSHPRLLDYLANTFIENGWSLKQLHRSIMHSAVYQQRSTPSVSSLRKRITTTSSFNGKPKATVGRSLKQRRLRLAVKRVGPNRETVVAGFLGKGAGIDPELIDPENRLLWKFNRRRLDFEATRDSLLAVCDGLDRVMGGKPVQLLKKGFVPRRTVYGFVDRMDLPGLFRAFDFPEPAASSPARDSTTVAPQALYLMNNDFVVEIARRLAARPDIAEQANVHDKLRRIYSILYSREPAPDELKLAIQYLGAQSSNQRWIQYAQALLMTNEFVFVD